ncbi:hypothetical protein J6590_003761 [Homalodisca vitripennis]|nr:hypothetical protein J6590_003761 [Homalodisca vitripennis]
MVCHAVWLSIVIHIQEYGWGVIKIKRGGAKDVNKRKGTTPKVTGMGACTHNTELCAINRTPIRGRYGWPNTSSEAFAILEISSQPIDYPRLSSPFREQTNTSDGPPETESRSGVEKEDARLVQDACSVRVVAFNRAVPVRRNSATTMFTEKERGRPCSIDLGGNKTINAHSPSTEHHAHIPLCTSIVLFLLAVIQRQQYPHKERERASLLHRPWREQDHQPTAITHRSCSHTAVHLHRAVPVGSNSATISTERERVSLLHRPWREQDHQRPLTINRPIVLFLLAVIQRNNIHRKREGRPCSIDLEGTRPSTPTHHQPTVITNRSCSHTAVHLHRAVPVGSNSAKQYPQKEREGVLAP